MRAKPYVATISVLAVTGVLTALQFALPELLSLLGRTPMAIRQHQWWRLITPLFVHDGGWRQVALNFPAISVVGLLVERLFGSLRWLVVYFVSGLVGELAGYAWQPVGAGASVAGAGLLGALAVWLIRENRSPRAVTGGAIIIVGGAVLAAMRDLHGPPVLAGACMGWAMLRREAANNHLLRQPES